MKNADLWRKLDAHLSARPQGSVQFLKVRGHASTADVVEGRTTDFNKFGNDAADHLAVCGACANVARKAHMQLSKRSLNITMRVQRMMLEVVIARSKSSPVQAEVVDLVSDSSSDDSSDVASLSIGSDWSAEPPD